MSEGERLPHDYDPRPYILAAEQTYDRESAAEWARWRVGRHSLIPAPRLTLEEYLKLSAHRRMLYDLHRSVTNSNLPILETPMTARLTTMIESRIKSNALKRGPATREGIMLSGGGFQGKTETVCEIAAGFEDYWLGVLDLLAPAGGTRDLVIPVAYVQTPVTATPKALCQSILSFYGAWFLKSTTLPQLLQQVKGCLRDNRTKVLIIDDVTRLRLNRADDQDTFDLIRGLMSMQVTLVLVGVNIRGSGLLRRARFDARSGQWAFESKPGDSGYNEEAATQHERRFNLLELEKFGYTTHDEIEAWVTLLAGIEQYLCLLKGGRGMLSTGELPEYLYRRTDGILGYLTRLIEPACEMAMASGEECLSIELLDTITIDPREAPGRDADAGEIPLVPGVPHAGAEKTKKPRKPRKRNGSFNDTGPFEQAG